MDRPIRRKDRAMTEEEARALLERGEYGVLSTVSGDGIPYGVPLSYVVMNGGVYFHCAGVGRKIEYLAAQPMVSFCVVGYTQPVYEQSNFSTYYESAIVRGSAVPVTDAKEKYAALHALCQKYLPAHMGNAEVDIKASIERTAVYRISVDAISGKHKTPKP